jgi:ABC-type amino acid transport substrate-binding protein
MSVHGNPKLARLVRARGLAVVVCGLLALAVSACGSSDSDNDDGGAKSGATPAAAARVPAGLVNDGTITFGTDFTFPPYENIVKGKQEGFDVEFGQLLAKRMGVKAKFVDNRFASLIPALQAHKFDVVLSAMYITPERYEQVDFVPYFNTGNVIVVKKAGGYQPKAPIDLCGHVFSIQEGAFVEGVARKELNSQCKTEGKGDINVKSFQTDTASFQEVAAGRADVTFGDSAVTVARIKQTPALGLHISSPSGKLYYATPGGIAVRKGDTELNQAITKAVQALESSGELDSLRKRYGLAAPDPAQVAKAQQEAEK